MKKALFVVWLLLLLTNVVFACERIGYEVTVYSYPNKITHTWMLVYDVKVENGGRVSFTESEGNRVILDDVMFTIRQLPGSFYFSCKGDRIVEFLEIYLPIIRVTTKSVLSGEHVEYEDWKLWNNDKLPILCEFFKDNDLQEITICSGNIGFIKTFRKFYIAHEDEVLRLKAEAEKEKADA